jgi:hypothetical protein
MTQDKAVNTAIIGLCVVLAGDVLWMRIVKPAVNTKPVATAARETTRRPTYKVGEPFQLLTGFKSSPGIPYLFLIVRDGCRYCDASTDFYRRVVEASRGGKSSVQVIGLCLNPGDVCAEYFKRGGIAVDRAVSAGTDRLQIAGTPTLVLVDERGSVQSVWEGQLAPVSEQEVLAVMASRSGNR